MLWTAVAASVAFFVGQALAPGAALYTRILSARAIGVIGALPKDAFLLVGALAARAVAGRFEASNPARWAWRIFALAMLGLFLGQAVLTYYRVTGQGVPFPTVGDLFFVLGTMALVVALVAFVRAYAASGFPIGQPAQLWTVGIVGTLLGAALVVPLLRPIVAVPAPPIEKALNIAYPMLDFLTLVPALLLLWISLRMRGGRVGSVWGALVAGILFTTIADVLFGFFSNLGRTDLIAVIDALYLLAYGCLAASAIYQRELVAG
jgi:hypothetical protein